MANDKDRESPVPPGEAEESPASVTPITSAGYKRTPQDSLLTVQPGAVIKEAGIAIPHGFVVLEGSVDVECHIATLTGSVVKSLGVVSKYEHFNIADLLGEDARWDKQCKFTARTMTILATIKRPFNLSTKSAPAVLFNFAKVERRRNNLNTDVLIEEVKDKEKLRADLERAHRGEILSMRDENIALERKIVERDEEIERLKKEQPSKSELDAIDMGTVPGELDPKKLFEEVGSLRLKLKDAEKERIKTARHSLECVLEWNEQIARSSIQWSDWAIQMAQVLGITLTAEQLEAIRKHSHTMVPRISEENINRLLEAAWPAETVTAGEALDKIGDRQTSVKPPPPPRKMTIAFASILAIPPKPTMREGAGAVQPAPSQAMTTREGAPKPPRHWSPPESSPHTIRGVERAAPPPPLPTVGPPTTQAASPQARRPPPLPIQPPSEPKPPFRPAITPPPMEAVKPKPDGRYAILPEELDEPSPPTQRAAISRPVDDVVDIEDPFAGERHTVEWDDPGSKR